MAGSPHGSAVAHEGAVARLLAMFDHDRDALVEEILAGADDSVAYSRLAGDPRQRADMAAHINEVLDALRMGIAADRPLTAEDLAFVRPHIRLRASRQVPLADCLRGFRIVHRVLFAAILRTAPPDPEGRLVALQVADRLMTSFDVASEVAAEAYMDVQEMLLTRGSGLRRDLLEDLISGVVPTTGPKVGLARASGLASDADVLLVVARAQQPAADPHLLHAAAVGLARMLETAVQPLCVARQDEVVTIAAVADEQVAALPEHLSRLQAETEAQGLRLSIGTSAVHTGLAELRDAYHEASLAADSTHDGVLVLATMTAFDFLTIRPDRTAWHLVPPPIRRFVQADAADGGALSDTLVAFVDCDLNVKLAAEDLFVHPNTVHHRLTKIAERTGTDFRNIKDVLDLLIAIHLHRQAG